jgi:AAA family ATP:ADP antiporter
MRDNSLLIQRINLLLAGSLVVFFLLHSSGISVGLPFYVWVGVLSVMVTSQFWAFVTDLYNVKTGQRLFAIVGFGISIGAVIGAQLNKALVTPLGSGGLMLLSAAIFVVSLPLSRRAQRAVPEDARALPVEHEPDKARRWLGGLALVFRDNYLLLLATLVVLSNWALTTGEYVLADYLQQAALAMRVEQREAFIGSFMADVYAWITILSTFIQLALVSRIIIKFGVRAAVAIPPLLFLLGYLAMGVLPILLLVKWTIVGIKSLDYSLLNTSRNALLLPTSRESKYEGKTAIDTFFFRFGDLLSAGTIALGIRVLHWDHDQFIYVSAAFSALMLLTALLIGKRYAKKVSSRQFNQPPVVNRVVSDVRAPAGLTTSHVVPEDAFFDADPGDFLTLSACLEDGTPLPAWIRFLAASREFEITPPDGQRRELRIELKATDYDGLSVSQIFRVIIVSA